MKHKLLFQRFFASLLLLAVSTLSWAYDFKVDGIYYNISGQNATVTKGDAAYSGTIVIPSTVKYRDLTYSVNQIDGETFSGCSNMVSLTIPNTIKYLGNRAFSGCAGKLYINCDIPDCRAWNWDGHMAETAYFGPFVGSGFTEVVIGDDATSIGHRAFLWSNNLKSLTVGKNVTTVARVPFDGCNSLTTIKVVSNNPTYDSRNNCNAIIESANDSLVCGCKNTIIPNSVTSIGESAFQDCRGLTSITIPESVTSIGYRAFYGCTSLPVENGLRYANTYLVEAVDKTQSTYSIKSGTRFIGSSAFSGCKNLTSVTLPEGLTSIGSSAFNGCSGLTSITIPESVTSINEYAFYNCSGLTSITIPESVTSINEYAFYNCSGLTSITLPEGLTSIGSSAFRDCSGLTSVAIPNSVKSIGYEAFRDCSGLTSITIPESVTSISGGAFGGCSGLTSVTLNSNAVVSEAYGFNNNMGTRFGTQVTEYIIGDGVTSIGKYAFYECSGLTSITIPESVTTIGDHAFYDCSSLTSITLPEGLTSIGESAFSCCINLTSVTIPNSVTTIGSHAFASCHGLKSFIMGNHVTSIGDRAFVLCSKLNSVVIPESVTRIDDYAFYNCSSLTSVTLNSNAVVSKAYSSNNNLGNRLFGTQVTEYIIGDGVTSIGQYAFYKCSGLTSITIPESVTTIGDYAFSGCSNLASLNIPQKVETIGEEAFRDCSGIAALNIPENTKNIDRSAFRGCSKLNSIVVDERNIYYDSRDHCNALIEKATNTIIAGSNNTVIPNSVKAIAPYAFYYRTNLVAITIPEGLTSIGYDAFDGCSSLVRVTINDNDIMSKSYEPYHDIGNVFGHQVSNYIIGDAVTSIGEYAFDQESALMSVTIGNNVTSIGDYAFSNCKNLTSVTIGNSVTSIGKLAFASCSSLTSITIPNNVKSIGEGAFGNCSGLTSVTIPNSVTSISKGAFDGCSGLTSVTLPESLTTISERAFFDCSGLTTVTIPESVTSIGGLAFGSCSGLTSIIIPKSVTIIGPSAFRSCSALTSAIIGNGVTNIGPYAFEYCSNLTSITIPESVTTIGGDAFHNCVNLMSITIPESVTTIGDDAFSGCRSLPVIDNLRYADSYLVEAVDKTLSTYNIKSGTRFIGSYAFKDCLGLTSITIPNSVTSIGEGAFRFCSGLTSVTLPESMTRIGYGAFRNCSGLTSITIPENVTSIGDRAFDGCSGLTSVTIGSSVTSIGDQAFDGCSGLTSITIPGNVKRVGYRAFSNCAGMKKVTCMATNLPELGNEVFYDVPTGTATLYVPASAYDAYKSATQWKDFGSIEMIYLPASSIRLNEEKISVCKTDKYQLIATVMPKDAIQNVKWSSSDSKIAKVNNDGLVTGIACGTATITATTTDGTNLSASCQVTVDSYYLRGNCGPDLSYTLSDSYVLTITGTGAMSSFTSSNQPWKKYADKIVSVSLPEGITSIGSNAFNACTSLESLTCLAKTVPSIGSGAFNGVPLSDATLSVPYSVLNAYKSATTWKSFGTIDPIYLPATSITMSPSEGQLMLNEQVNLTVQLSPDDANPRVIWKSSNPEIATVDDSGVVTGVATGTATITATTTDGTNLSANCMVTVEPCILKGKCGTNLTYVLDDKFVLTITGTGAMNSFTSSSQPWNAYADKILSVSLPEGITSIGSYAFSGCSMIKSIDIPQDVTYMGGSAFQNCSSVETFTCSTSRIPSLGNQVFYGMNQSGVTLLVKDELLDTYKRTSQWKDFGTIIAFEDLPSSLQYYSYNGEESVLNNKSDWDELLTNLPNAIALADDEHKNWATRHSNVLVKNGDDTYKCGNFQLIDLSQGYSNASEATKTGFFTPVSFSVTKGSYKRQAYTGYNTLCLPFSFKASDLSSSAKVFTFDAYDADKTKVIFKAVSGTIAAGTPCIVKEMADVVWTVDLSGKNIEASQPSEESHMCGTYVTTDAYQGKGYSPRSSDGNFAPLTQYLHPFRACILLEDLNNANARGSLSVVFMDEDGVTVIDEINATSSAADTPKSIYTLGGQRVNEVKRSGLYIVNGKKQYIEVK